MKMFSVAMINQLDASGDKVIWFKCRANAHATVIIVWFHLRCFTREFQTILWFYSICYWTEWIRRRSSSTITPDWHAISTRSTVWICDLPFELSTFLLFLDFSKREKLMKQKGKKHGLNKHNGHVRLCLTVLTGLNKTAIDILSLEMKTLLARIGRNVKNIGKGLNSSNCGRTNCTLVQWSFLLLCLLVRPFTREPQTMNRWKDKEWFLNNVLYLNKHSSCFQSLNQQIWFNG